MNYKGVIIKESLEDPEVLREVKILETKVKPVTKKYGTPWIKQWTLYTVEIPEERADGIAKILSEYIDRTHASSWYADFKNNSTHYIIFRNKVSRIDRRKAEEYEEAKRYGIRLGIPGYQLDFSPEIIVRQ